MSCEPLFSRRRIVSGWRYIWENCVTSWIGNVCLGIVHRDFVLLTM